jgi:hypothetical protein
MAPSILIFDFGTNEEAAQQAKHKIEGWTQGFRLGKKISVKFEREDFASGAPNENDEHDEDREPDEEDAASSDSAAKKSAGKSAATKKAPAKKHDAKKAVKAEKPADASKVLLLVQLDFSDHEKLSHQRWLDRIPSEDPFKSAAGETIRQNDPGFDKAKDRFDKLS